MLRSNIDVHPSDGYPAESISELKSYSDRMKHRSRMMMLKIFVLFFTGTVIVLLIARQLLQQHFRAHPGLVHTPYFVEWMVNTNSESVSEKVVIEVRPDWSLEGAMHLNHLLGNDIKFYDNCRFFRVLPGVVAQVGISGDPAMSAQWSGAVLQDEPVMQSNIRGTLGFTHKPGRKNTRTTLLYINLQDNPHYDAKGYSPIGKVVSGMDVLDKLQPQPLNVNEGSAIKQGNEYLDRIYEDLSWIESAQLMEPEHLRNQRDD